MLGLGLCDSRCSLTGVLERMSAWVESCPCHSPSLADLLGLGHEGYEHARESNAALKCPLRARRAAEVT